MPKNSTMQGFFFIEDIEFGIERISKGKDKDVEGYQYDILKTFNQNVIV
jgi:hypothetical protein